MNKKEEIMQTAIQLFVTQGFENTPTSQISKEAKVATGTLFHHFSTKEDLINSAYLYVKKKAISETKVQYESDVKESLRKTWNAGMEWGFKNKTYVDFGFRFANSNYITKLTQEQAEVVFEPFEEIIAEGLKKGIVKEFPQAVLAGVYWGIYQSFLNYMCEAGRLDNKFISEGFDLLWDALKK